MSKNRKRQIVRTYTKQRQACMINTDLFQSYFTSSLPGFRQFVGRFGDQVFKIIIQFQVVGFCCFCNTVYNGAGFCTCNRIDHDPVLFADTESTDRLLSGIVVHWNFSVIKEHLQVFFLIDGVIEARPCFAFLWDFQDVFPCPCEIGPHQRADV